MSGRAWLELILLSCLWGGTFFSVAIALDEIGPMTAVLHRVGWAALVLWAVVLIRRHRIPLGLRDWSAFLVMGCLNNVIPFSLMSWGQTQIETGLVSIFNAMTAIFGVLVAAMLLRDERLTPRRGIGVALGFAGVVAITGIDRLGALDPRSLGQYAVLAGTVSYAFASVWGKLRLRGHPPELAAAGMLTGSTILMLPLVLWTEGVPQLALSTPTWVAIGYYAGFATAVAYLLYYRVLAMAGAGNLMLCTLMIPAIAILLGWAFLDETLEPRAYWGLSLIAGGLLVIDGRLLNRMFGSSGGDRGSHSSVKR